MSLRSRRKKSHYQCRVDSINIMSIPSCIKNTRTCVYVKTDENQSFKWIIFTKAHPVHNGYRLGPYKKFENELNFHGIEFLTKLTQIPRFEKA